MAKAAKPVKWALGAEEPEDLDDFLSNDDIVLKNTSGKGKNKEVNWPGKGPFTFKVVQARVKPNRNGDDRIGVMLVLKEPKKSEAASWNGYMIWDGFNVTEQGAPFLKRWLRALGLTWADFIKKSKMDDQDPPHLVQIGKVKLEGTKDVTLRATVKVMDADDYNDDEHLEIGRYLPADDEEPEPEDVEDDEDEDDEDDVEVVEEDDEEDEDEEDEEEDDDDEDEDDEDDDEDEDEDDEEEELREELSGLKVAALQKRAMRLAKKNKVETDEVPTKKADLVEWIVAVEMGEPPF